jgi:hypothetical protein
LDINGIALVEIATSNALFFDLYDRSRTTGSFILIDPLSNATVGAGMIRESQTTGGRLPSVEETRISRTGESPVSTKERLARHGHRPGIFFLPGGGVLAKTVERTLFDAGFEVALLHADKFEPAALAVVAQSMWSLGFVLVVAVAKDLSEAPVAMHSFDEESVFDHSSARFSSGTDDTLAEVLLEAESLRLESIEPNVEKEH